MDIFYVLLILLAVTRVFGEFAVRLKQPPLVGELIAGILLGLVIHQYAGTLPGLEHITDNEVFLAITDLGIFFLMLLGGIEMRPKELTQSSGSSFIVALCAMALPLGLGMGTAWLFLPESDYKLAQALFVGTGLAITAVPVAIRVLLDLDKLDSKFGRLIVSAAVFDDVLSLILLAVLTALIRTGGLPDLMEMVLLVGKIGLFFAITVAAGRFVLPTLGRFVKRFVKLDELEFSFLVISALAFAVLAEALELHFILGAFIAGLFFGRRTITPEVYDDVKRKISGITTGFLAPIFFASIGLHLDLSAVTEVPLFLSLLIIIAFASKMLGATVPAMLCGYSGRESLAVGIAMSARGAVELIIADIALRAGLFEVPESQPGVVKYMFSTLVIVAIVTTLAASTALRFAVRDDRDAG